jgi:hypothetical protein
MRLASATDYSGDIALLPVSNSCELARRANDSMTATHRHWGGGLLRLVTGRPAAFEASVREASGEGAQCASDRIRKAARLAFHDG